MLAGEEACKDITESLEQLLLVNGHLIHLRKLNNITPWSDPPPRRGGTRTQDDHLPLPARDHDQVNGIQMETKSFARSASSELIL